MPKTAREIEERYKEHYDEQGINYENVDVAKLTSGDFRVSVDGMFVCKIPA